MGKIIVSGLLVLSLAGCMGAKEESVTSEEVTMTESEISSSGQLDSSAPNEEEKKVKSLVREESKKEMEEIGIIETKFGKITIRFFPQDAPCHVENFKKLAKAGFYNETTFHRVIPGFMIQGGDPNSKDDDRTNDGMGGPGYTIKAEFNSRSHQRGIVSMARSAHPDSAGSQFFICVVPATFLDGQYTVLGEVIEGMDVADKIVNVQRDSNDNPIEKIPMTVSIVSVEKAD